MRRLFITYLLAALPMLMLGAGAQGADTVTAAGPVKVVYHLADGLDQASRAMGNIRNHLRAEPDTKIVVVANGDGIKFLLAGAKERNGKPFDAAVSALAAQGVEFRVCRNTLTAHDVPVSQLVPEAKLVTSGVVEVSRLQAKEGFVYLRP
ncbi:MAG TPA: DsrE family protein [Noviherbaspirillum sp.]|nr:DsrE family protein [Noviherbaspirillum sp.]